MKKILLIMMAMFAFGLQNVNAQDKPIKIVTGHPDFSLKITRCVASGKNVVLDMVVTNLSDNDVECFKVHGSSYATKVYDDQGNIYDSDIDVKIANKQYTTGTIEIKLVAGIPTKYSLMIANVSQKAQYLVLVEPDIYVPAWKTVNSTVKIRNVPITRE